MSYFEFKIEIVRFTIFLVILSAAVGHNNEFDKFSPEYEEYANSLDYPFENGADYMPLSPPPYSPQIMAPYGAPAPSYSAPAPAMTVSYGAPVSASSYAAPTSGGARVVDV